MKIEDWALIISIVSVVISICGFVWNVWSKFIYPKARVRVSINLMDIMEIGKKPKSIVSLSATNFGPTEVTLHLAISRRRPRLWISNRDTPFALLKPLDNVDAMTTSGPFSGGLPKKLMIGEQFSAYLPVVREWFEKNELDLFGFSDTFNRFHWCSRRNAADFRRKMLNNS